MLNLTESIKKHGIIEPLLLRPYNGKYEILLGNKRYEIAKKLNFITVPALVKEIDEELYQEYKKLNNINQNKKKNNNKFINLNPQYNDSEEYPKNRKKIKNKEKEKNTNTETTIIPMNNFNNRKDTRNNDIINLSELNKEEYEERDENIMNNNIANNQGVPAQNLGNPSMEQSPSFGGRFFPSLEDEPTNMNMETTGIIGEAMKNATPINPNPTNNNLIDLTDINGDAAAQGQSSQLQENIMQSNQMSPMDNMNNTMNNIQPAINPQQHTPENQNFLNTDVMQRQQEFSMDMPSPIQDPVTDMNMQQSSLEQNSNILQQGSQQTPMGQNNQIPNNFNNKETIEQPVMGNQFDMSQSMMPEQNMNMQSNLEAPVVNSDISMPNNNFDIPQMPMDMPQMPSETNQVINNIPNENIDSNMNIPTPEIKNEQINPLPEMNMGYPNVENNQGKEQQSSNIENITPVINTLKGLATNLQGFGYNLNISEEESDLSVKLTIEIKK